MNSLVLDLPSWQTPATAYPKRRHGKAAICRIRYDGLYHMYMVPTPSRDGVEGQEYGYFRAHRMTVTNLTIDGEVWMVDDPPHHYGMIHHASHYHGHVLVAGLGLGLIVHALTARPQVESITVVERCRDVIDLVGPLVPHDKLKIVQDDWYGYRHQGPVDGVLFDLFVGDGFALLGEAASVLLDIWERYPALRDRGGPVRIHGMSQPLVQRLAHTILASRDLGSWLHVVFPGALGGQKADQEPPPAP